MADLDGDGLVTFDEFLKYHALLKEHGAEMSAEAEMVRLLRDCSVIAPRLLRAWAACVLPTVDASIHYVHPQFLTPPHASLAQTPAFNSATVSILRRRRVGASRPRRVPVASPSALPREL